MIIYNSALDTWKNALKYVNDKGQDFVDQRNRVCHEVVDLSTRVLDPESVFMPILLLSSIKKWSYPLLEEIEALIISKNIMEGFYGYSYTDRIFSHNGINQIDHYVIPLLREDPFTRRAVIGLWNPVTDCNKDNPSTPSILTIRFAIRNELLHITLVIRSNDMFFGYPANLYQGYVLQKYVGEKLGVKAGPITIYSMSAHIFKDSYEDVLAILKQD